MVRKCLKNSLVKIACPHSILQVSWSYAAPSLSKMRHWYSPFSLTLILPLFPCTKQLEIKTQDQCSKLVLQLSDWLLQPKIYFSWEQQHNNVSPKVLKVFDQKSKEIVPRELLISLMQTVKHQLTSTKSGFGPIMKDHLSSVILDLRN